ncbi:FAD-dependent monooxygenase [Actinokineospora spheciospongiae]|uniref:FAD-dependent monooxygenase n=1 Tax=Actinokineospora spheciospongiae TaxID=909613 RepID=UPI000D7123E9|nr:FAD-dependent monooxygenase [Actinokineospora spheciospongiae]PWW64212.1 2-polyprenyl-6-methoxyphenol hydroxylase-like FAD-dependent oxidoreductase [Actinokineospora spheciospongiae]
MTAYDVHTVLVSGAGVAGPALAYWLRHHGFALTVVERAPAPRPGGQAVDVRGPAVEVLDRMGVLAEVRAARTGTLGTSYVDAGGAELSRTEGETFTGGPVDGPDIEVLRDDLSEILVRAAPAEYLYGDTITALDQDDHGVLVHFERSAPRRFDLVIGADGLHSRVRSLAFGEVPPHHLGVALAVFSTPNTFGLDRWQVFHSSDAGMVGVYSARANAEARVVMGWHCTDLPRDPDAQRTLVAEAFAGGGWETPALVEAMRTAPDFYCDTMSQVHLDTWSRGRVGLLGDAAHCPSPLSGQGTSLALVGAYVLAGELAHGGGLAGYESAMREYVRLNQALATEHQGAPPPPEAMRKAVDAIDLKAY